MEIYGTLGPACANAAVLEQMFRSGMTGLRLNLSHASLKESGPPLEQMRLAAERCGIRPQLLIDLQGPELRVGKRGLPRLLEEGTHISLSRLALPEHLYAALQPGMELLLDDGRLCVQVLPEGEGRVLRGGTLAPGKSIAVPGLCMALPALTAADRKNLSLRRHRRDAVLRSEPGGCGGGPDGALRNGAAPFCKAGKPGRAGFSGAVDPAAGCFGDRPG